MQELGTRGHESPRRLGGRTGPVPSSSHTYAAPTACGQGRDRADTAALRRPGVYAVARRPPDRQRGGAGLPEEGRGAHTVDGGLPPVGTARPPPPDRTCPCLDGQWRWGGTVLRWAWPLDGGPAGGRAEGKAGPLTLLPAPPPSSAISSILGTWLDQYSEDFCQPPDWSASHLEAAGGEGRTLKTAGQGYDASGPAAGRCLCRANSGDRQKAGQWGRLLPLLN